ncbi:hypothetical protein KM043_018445 [Ampulex compressa]|nr:hypothetical protein KM043_018445 [Ampulex compressa]
MKIAIVLFAVVAVASAYPGVIPWAAPVAHPWPAAPAWQPAAWPAPAPTYVKVAPAPTYVKVAAPQVHAPEVHHVINVPQPQPIPPIHPQPLNIKVPHSQSVRIPYHAAKIGIPHLIGYEAQAPEPQIKVVKAAHHPWA